MRSVDEMRAVVHAEAARRERRTKITAGASAVAVGGLALIVLVAAIRFAPPAAEVSTGAGPEPTPVGSSVAPDPSTGSAPGTRSAATSPGPDPSEAEGGAEAGIDPTSTAAGAPPTSRRPRRPAGAGAVSGSDGSVATEGDTEAPPDRSAPTGSGGGPASPDPTPPTRTPDPSTTIDPHPPGPTGNPNDPSTPTTTTGPRTCTAGDLEVTRITWRSTGSGDPYPDRTAPTGEATWFALSVWATEGTPCVTADERQELTITDAGGAVVHRRSFDDGPGRLTAPGEWLARDVAIGWDPGCVEPAPDGWSTAVCIPVGPGSYTAQLHIDGTDPPPLDLTILGP